MNIQRFFDKYDLTKAFYRCADDFGELDQSIEKNNGCYFADAERYSVHTELTRDNYGVYSRKDTLKNTSDNEVHIRSFKSRFLFEGGEYEVYTQFNSALNESEGAWQSLETSVTGFSQSTRTLQGATPFFVLWSKQSNRGIVFHLMPNCAWEYKVTRLALASKESKVLVEMGVIDYNLNISVKPGEEINFPEIICYETKNKLDFDCYKLHNYMHTNYPRKDMPMIFNSWMYRFTKFTIEQLFEQAEYAAKLGLEYFVIDVGWFGDGIWFYNVGNWRERLDGGFYGRMKELADKVRSLGMKFGLWFEVSRGHEGTDAINEHSEYYIKEKYRNAVELYYLDFSNPDARAWMLGILDKLIKEYGVEFIKADYNANMYYDVYKSSFLTYHEGLKDFVSELRKHNPNLYITACASGGERAELNNYANNYDSFWPSDNHNPYDQMEMYKGSLLRLPPQGLERWTCVHSLTAYEDFYKPFGNDNPERLIASADDVWKNIRGINPSYLDAFQTAGPIGFSCDLTQISEKAFNHMKEKIATIKSNREFWKKAVARILVDTKTVTVYQYSDMELTNVVIQIISLQTFQESIVVYPVVNETKTYLINGETEMTGKEIMENGIESPISGWHEMTEINITQLR